MKTPRKLILEEIEEIARLNGVPMRDLMGRCKTKDAVRARRAAMWLVWFKYGKSLGEVAKVFGKSEHTTTLHAIGVHLLKCGFHDHPMAISAKRRQQRVRDYHKTRTKLPWKLTNGARTDRNRRRRERHVPKAQRAAA